MFRNLILFQIADAKPPSHQDIEGALEGARLRSPGPQELATHGFISPYGRGQDVLVHGLGSHTLLSLGSEARLLPAQVVNDALADKLDALASERGRRPGGRERMRVKDEVITDLLPRAFIKSTRTDAWLDHDKGWLAIDSSSRKSAETLVHAVREAVGSFPATPVGADGSARSLLTRWLGGNDLPGDFALGDECELRDPGDDGAIARCRRQDLDSDEIREHLNAGKQAVQLALTYDDRISFVLADDLSIRKLRFGDVVLEQLGDIGGEDAIAELDARFALMTAELSRLFERLDALFELT